MKILFESFARCGSTYLCNLMHVMYRCKMYGEALPYYDVESKYTARNDEVSLCKTHRPDAEPCLGDRVEFKYRKKDFDSFVCILRSPLEAITRHNEWDVKMDICRGDKWRCEKTEDFLLHYIQIIKDYERFNGPKYMAFYEDLMEDPRGTLQNIKETLGAETYNSIDMIVNNLGEIRKWSAAGHKFLDNKSDSGGEINFDPYKHQRGMPLEIFEYYKRNLEPYNEYVERYFEEGPVYERWKSEQN